MSIYSTRETCTTDTILHPLPVSPCMRISHVAPLEVQDRKLGQRCLVGARYLDDHIIKLLCPLGFDRLEPVTKDRMVGGIEQRFHRWPFTQKGLAHLVSQSSQCPKLRLQGQLVLAIEIFQPTGSAGFPQRLRQLLGLDVPRFDAVQLKQLSLGKGFERTNERDHRSFRILRTMQSSAGIGEQIERLHILYGSRIEDELFQESRIRFNGW